MSSQQNYLRSGSAKQRPHTAGSIRIVPPFSIQSLQKNTIVCEAKFPKKCKKMFIQFLPIKSFITIHKLYITVVIDKHKYQKTKSSFRTYYDRGDLPIKMEYLICGDKISWTVSTFPLIMLIFLLSFSFHHFM